MEVDEEALEVEELEVSDEEIVETSDNAINIHVSDSYDENNKTWVEDGVDLSGATVNLYDSSDKLVSTYTSDSKGKVSINNLNSSVYSFDISYSTYKPYKSDKIDFTVNKGTLNVEYIFVPDILLLVDYSSHNEKVDVLMNMSKRVCYISTTNFDVSREWLFEYAKYIHLDMFSESAYSVLTAKYLKELLASSPANANYKVAYTFGVYSDNILNNTGIHIVGANSTNNTYDTIENTYIGSYFQARDIGDDYILKTNMKNYFDYVCYLIDSDNNVNPTLDVSNAPLMSPECGFYHPDIGVYTVVPNSTLINEWILNNPGYTHSSDGSLNWMVENYEDWVVNVLDPTNLFRQFENNYTSSLPVDKKFIAIASYYCGEGVTDALIRAFESYGRPAFNIFKTGTKPSMSSILNKVNDASSVGISSVISLYSWSLSYANNSAEGDLSDIDLAILKGINEISEYSYNSELGPQIEWTYSVTYPSFEGVFSPVILSYVDSLGKTHVIQSGVDKMAKLSSQWADLKDLNNSDKKVAIVLYNYPPGKAEIGASYLDVFNSTLQLIVKLAENGYDIGMDLSQLMDLEELTQKIFDMNNKGSWAQGLLDKYVEDNWDYLVEHHQLISLNDFYKLTSGIDEDLYLQMINQWGDGLGPAMVYNDEYIVIPGFWFGNIFITFQPSRGWEEVNIISDYHNLTLPPHQQYVAFYEWLDQTAGINAIINMGTHGTVEWLPGSNLGAVKGDWTFELTLTPTLYPYIVSNPGEAMVARDRIAALTITHMTPAMVSSELYGNYSLLEDYITRYKDQISLNVTSNADVYKEKILNLAPALGFRNYTKNENFTSWLDDLHLYLESLSDDFNSYGLHVLGKVLSGYELVEEVNTIVTSQTKVYNYIFNYLYPNSGNLNYYTDVKDNVNYLSEANATKAFLKQYIWELVNGSSVYELNEKYNILNGTDLYNITLYCVEVINNILNNNEWNAIFTALNGGYVPSGLFADPAYGDSIPTGYSGYASDSTKMPSEAAYESAVKIVDMLLADYYEEHGKWPELTSLILWGTEISRTEGIGIAEFLYFMGCKPVWSDNGKVIGVELLPLSDLKVTLNNASVVNRPRIDVFASIVTSNKDWIKWMVTAVRLANATGEDESDNYIIKHYNQYPSLDRLFGLPGNVLEGTGMSNLIPNTADWDISTVNEKALDVYLNRVSYAWSIDDNGNIVIKNQEEAYKYLLSNVDLITQNFDSTWRLFDSDDYYDWFGGMLNAAKILSKRAGNNEPDTAFVDIRNKNNYISRTYEEELEFEVRSILLNPQYYNALVSNAAGMNAYASRFQNFYASLVISGNKLNNQLGNQLADTILSINSGVDKATLAAGSQTSMAWMIYMAQQGLWKADASTLNDLVDSYMKSVIDYGVACCHHTCKNLEWNSQIIQMSSLTPAQKSKFAEILASATATDPLYKQSEQSSQTAESSSGEGEESGSSGKYMSNGTSEESSKSSSNGGQTAVGEDASASGDAQVSDSSSMDSQSASQAGSSGKAYEISQSVSKSSSATESSMPIFVILAVVSLIAIFLVGYLRSKEEYDDY